MAYGVAFLIPKVLFNLNGIYRAENSNIIVAIGHSYLEINGFSGGTVHNCTGYNTTIGFNRKTRGCYISC